SEGAISGSGLLITDSWFGLINLSKDEKRLSYTLVVGMDRFSMVGIVGSSKTGLGSDDWGSSP
ncbi:hypothetical protein A2U01_0074099, partial [Trifolium medium]|nr:hypothetical protein [Trifolium medium]